MWKTNGFSRKFIAWLVAGVLITCCLMSVAVERYCSKILQRGEIPLLTARKANSLIGIISRKATGDIVDVTLENTGYTKWEKYKDSLDTIVKELDLLPGGGKELVVAISLPPQEGLVAVYSRQGNRLVYRCKISSLFPVTHLSGIEVDFSEQQMLVVDQHQDEMLGAFFTADYKEFFIWNGRYFTRVLGLITGYSAFWNQAWDGAGEGAHWLWLRQVPQVEYGEGGSIIRVKLDQALLQSKSQDTDSIPGKEDFIKRHGRTVTQEYRWSTSWGRYIIGEGVDRLTGEEVAVLEDYSKSISGLLDGKHKDMVKVIDREGEIKIIPADGLKF